MKKTREDLRQRRKLHIRKLVSGTAEKPRVYVYSSNKHIYAGVADDIAGKVLMSVAAGKNVAEATKLGIELGKKMKEAGYLVACFDRSGYKYHLRLNAIVESLRKTGISI